MFIAFANTAVSKRLFAEVLDFKNLALKVQLERFSVLNAFISRLTAVRAGNDIVQTPKGGTVMEHAKALVVKFIMVAVVLGIILSAIFNMPFGDMIATSVVLTILAYVLGDLMIFKRENEREEDTQRNIMATVADFVLAYLVVWLMGRSLAPDMDNLLWAALASSIVIAAGEWFFHKYLHHLFHQTPDREYTGYGGD